MANSFAPLLSNLAAVSMGLRTIASDAIQAKVTVEAAVGSIGQQAARGIREMDSAAKAYERQQQQYINDILAMHDDAIGSWYGYTASALQQYIDLLKAIAANPEIGKDFQVQDSMRKAEEWIRKWGGKAGDRLDFNALRRRILENADAAIAADSGAAMGGSASGSTAANFNVSLTHGKAGQAISERIEYLISLQSRSNEDQKALIQREIDALKYKLDHLPAAVTENVKKTILTAPTPPKNVYITGTSTGNLK